MKCLEVKSEIDRGTQELKILASVIVDRLN